MARTVGIGNQSFEVIRREDYFYIDKTPFIKEWWESGNNGDSSVIDIFVKVLWKKGDHSSG